MIIQMGDEKLCELFMKPDVFFFYKYICLHFFKFSVYYRQSQDTTLKRSTRSAVPDFIWNLLEFSTEEFTTRRSRTRRPSCDDEPLGD